FFFFSSRRRHTRFSRDWSSDVCSSDLVHVEIRRVEPHSPVEPLGPEPEFVVDESFGRHRGSRRAQVKRRARRTRRHGYRAFGAGDRKSVVEGKGGERGGRQSSEERGGG